MVAITTDHHKIIVLYLKVNKYNNEQKSHTYHCSALVHWCTGALVHY